MAAGPSSTTFILPTATGAQDLDRCPACESPFASSHSTAHPILLPNCGCIYHAGCLVRVFAAQLALSPHHCLCPTCSIDGMVTHAFIHVAPGSSPDQVRLEATLYAEWDVLILRPAFPPVPLPRRPAGRRWSRLLSSRCRRSVSWCSGRRRGRSKRCLRRRRPSLCRSIRGGWRMLSRVMGRRERVGKG